MYKPTTKEELKILTDDENINLGDIDTSLITDMSELFQNSKRVNFEGLETWNTSNVVNMSSMFELAENFNYNINSWDVSKVENMSKMFSALCFIIASGLISLCINGILQILKLYMLHFLAVRILIRI